MKTVFKNLLFWFCALTLVLNVTACSDDDENEVILYGYNVSVNVMNMGSINDGFSIIAIADYQAAINQVVGERILTEPCDEEVIAACDEVYNTHRAEYPNWKGEISINRTQSTITSDEDAPSTVIKTYKYE